MSLEIDKLTARLMATNFGTVRSGETVHGVLVETIYSDRVTLTRNQQSVQLRLLEIRRELASGEQERLKQFLESTKYA